MYKPPIELFECTAFDSLNAQFNDFLKEQNKQKEEMVYKAVVRCGVNVDKEELIRALSYDVTQYNKGFDDGVEYGIRYILIQLKELGFFKEPESKEVVVNLDEDNRLRKVFVESFGLGNVADGDD